MSMEEYRAAHKAGQKDYRAHVARGQNPYLPVLDDILGAPRPAAATLLLPPTCRCCATPIWTRASATP